VRHIPVFLVSAAEELERSLRQGVVGFVSKPADKEQLGAAFSRLRAVVEKPVKNLLVVDREPSGQEEIRALIGNGDVTVKSVSGPGDALRPLLESAFDCMVLSVRGDEVDLDLLRQLEQSPELRRIPVVLYVATPTSPEAEEELRRLGRVLVLRDARSPERLLDETALFLHRNAARLPEDKPAMVRRLHSSAELLAGRTVLIVDDDVRNIFAMTSLLERHGIQVISAENGNEALERLATTPRIDLVLMDVMLPGMDGYETTRAIRRLPKLRSLPILALTAKAMKGDREKCLEAGASDYIAKPVEADHLVAQLRSWLHR
jgi:CheY-like chemotaxis protein